VVAAKPVEDPRPQLTLVGAIAGEGEGFAIFIDLRNNDLVRLRTGQGHAGWTLSSVKGREAILAKEKDTAVFVLPAPGAHAARSGAPGLPTVPNGPAVAAVPNTYSEAVPPGQPVVMPNDPKDFAPFTPRSTPKNGESDGL
jgi:general secretion pathway protein N